MVKTRGVGSVAGHAPRIPYTASTRRARTVAHVKRLLHQTSSKLVKRRRSKRQHTRKGAYSVTTIKSLSRDLLVEVVATVASRSFIDLHIIKICCKDFLDATEDSYV